MTKPHTRDLSIATQLGRVISIMSDGKARTLREVCCHGWEKHSSNQTIDGKQVWHYHLTPFPTTEAVAAKAVAA